MNCVYFSWWRINFWEQAGFFHWNNSVENFRIYKETMRQNKDHPLMGPLYHSDADLPMLCISVPISTQNKLAYNESIDWKIQEK